MQMGLENKIILVSGGASGIGEAIARVLAQENAVPCIIDCDNKNGSRVVQEIEAAGGTACLVAADLTEPSCFQEIMEEVIVRFKKIDGLVNNAGHNDGIGLAKGDYNGFTNSLKKNVLHYYGLAKAALPYLRITCGAIINISSKVAETGQGETSGYAAANGIRNELTENWAAELAGYGIRVNSVVVSECMTPQYEKWVAGDPGRNLQEITRHIPLGNRMTTPQEIADMAMFLLSPKSFGIQGQLIHVDGGYVHLDRRIALQ